MTMTASAVRGVRVPGCMPGGYTGWVTGWVIPGSSTEAGTPESGGMTAKRAPEPLQGWSGWSCCSVRPAVPGPTLRARSVPCRPLPGPGPPSPGYAASGPIRRDSMTFLVKLVKTTECHRNMSMRPVIVPNSKTDLKCRLLKFWDFHFSQPSLTRN